MNQDWIYVSEQELDDFVSKILAEEPRCNNCNRLLEFEGTAQRNGYLYADFNCGQGGHNTHGWMIK